MPGFVDTHEKPSPSWREIEKEWMGGAGRDEMRERENCGWDVKWINVKSSEPLIFYIIINCVVDEANVSAGQTRVFKCKPIIIPKGLP